MARSALPRPLLGPSGLLNAAYGEIEVVEVEVFA